MTTLDLRKQYAVLYKPSAKVPALVDVPPLRFLMLEGNGKPGSEPFQEAVESLFALAYHVKFEAKKRLDLIYQVMPLEGLYFSAKQRERAGAGSPEWRLQIMLPDDIDREFVEAVREKVAAKKRLPRVSDIRVQTFSEGRCVQILHLGPYSAETPTVKLLQSFSAGKGLVLSDIHHEIYPSDPNRTAPEKLKTVIRYPVSKR